MKKIIIKTTNTTLTLCLIFCVLSSSYVMAQKKSPPEFSLHAGAALATYAFKSAPKEASSLGYSSDFGVGFTGFFSQQLGIHVGASFGFFNVKSKVSKLQTLTPALYDDEHPNLRYDLYTTLSGYNDIHKTLFVNIPVMLQFQTKQRQYFSWKNTQKAGFYAAGGVKVFFLFNNKYEARVASLYNAAYYPQLDNWADTQEFKGFGTFNNSGRGFDVTGNLDFGILVALALEAGVKWRIDNHIFIYTGAFFDCALNDPIKDSRKPHENYIHPNDLSDLTILKYANKANLMTVGVKLRFAFTRPQRAY